jgi:YD repeat-containing protein
MRQYLLIVLSSNFFFGQSIQLENFAPKSPEASAFLKYGEYPVDLSTGVPSISIPIYTIEAGDYKMPITLDYHASGIKVSQEATWVGLGWNLNFGAQITLDKMDDSDEYNAGEMPKINDVSNYMIANSQNLNSSYLEGLSQLSWVKDLYSVSTPTCSGKFYSDTSEVLSKIVIFPPDAFKVQITGAGFTIIDKFGNYYYFGNTIETSKQLGSQSKAPYKSAWFVDKIKTNKNEEINFYYKSGGSLLQRSYSDNINLTTTINECVGQNGGITQSLSGVNTQTNQFMNYAKVIDYIKTKSTKIIFNSTADRYDFYNPNIGSSSLANGPRKLNQILIQKSNNDESDTYSIIKNFNLVYTYFTSSIGNLDLNIKRLKLNSIFEMDNNFESSGETNFTYSNINLPPKDSKSIDLYGYFNNQFNIDLIPKRKINFNPAWIGNQEIEIGSGNRSIQPLFIQAGILQKISYPTKGFTSFEYEPNSYFGLEDKPREILGADLYGVGIQNFPTPNENCEANNSCIKYSTIPFNGCGIVNARFKFKITNQLYNVIPIQNKHDYCRVKIYDATGLIYDTGKVKHQDYDFNLNFQGAGYISCEAYGQYVKVNGISINYFSNCEVNNFAGGLRIKSISNSNTDMALTNKKTFEYTLDNTLKSSGLLTGAFSLNNVNEFKYYDFTNCSVNGSAGGGIVGNASLNTFVKTYSSNTLNNSENNSVIYSEIKESNLDANDISKDLTTSYFTKDKDIILDQRGLLRFSNGYKRGKLISKKYFKKLLATNNSMQLLKLETNTFFEDSQIYASIKGFKMFKNANVETSINYSNQVSLNQIFEPLAINIQVPWFYQKSSENTDYFYDANNVLSGSNTSTINYFYDNPNHLQLTRTETINSKNETLKSINYYPDDLIGQPFMSNLKSLNRIGEVIKTENYNGSNLLSSQTKTYKDWGNNLFLPEYIKSSKGTPEILENRIKINVIDNTNGNTLELQQENGTVVSYIYGYNKTLPIAKIENATNAQIQTVLGLILGNINENYMTQIDNLRTLLPNSMVTTYSHIPLIGVSTITDPKGDKITYTYDSFNRLQSVKDKNGNILSENEYHYKN